MKIKRCTYHRRQNTLLEHSDQDTWFMYSGFFMIHKALALWSLFTWTKSPIFLALESWGCRCWFSTSFIYNRRWSVCIGITENGKGKQRVYRVREEVWLPTTKRNKACRHKWNENWPFIETVICRYKNNRQIRETRRNMLQGARLWWREWLL